MSAFNNNNYNLNNTSAGIEGRVSNLTAQHHHHNNNLDRRPEELNENHGIAATGLNEPPSHTSAGGNGLSMPIADTRKFDQQPVYDNINNSNHIGNTGIPPPNTAEYIRRNDAEEAIANGHHGLHYHGMHHERNGHHGVGSDEKTHHHDPLFAVGPSTTPGTHPSGAPLGAGLPNKDLKHFSDQKHNEKYGNAVLKEDDTKITVGDKIKGNLEKFAGKITGNETKVIEGENLAHHGHNV